jgi:hypothetical protein
MNTILREKECTFKPNIIKSYKKPRKDDRTLPEEQLEKYQEPLGKIQEESVRFDEEDAENEFLCTPTQPVQSLDGPEPSEYLFPVNPSPVQQKPPVRKYKNDKFNMLLDLIH